jgi:hypothetical protein
MTRHAVMTPRHDGQIPDAKKSAPPVREERQNAIRQSCKAAALNNRARR